MSLQDRIQQVFNSQWRRAEFETTVLAKFPMYTPENLMRDAARPELYTDAATQTMFVIWQEAIRIERLGEVPLPERVQPVAKEDNHCPVIDEETDERNDHVDRPVLPERYLHTPDIRFVGGMAPTHYCRECGALWRRFEDGGWNLRSKECGQCCDNTQMGEQIIAMGQPPAVAHVSNNVTHIVADIDYSALRECLHDLFDDLGIAGGEDPEQEEEATISREWVFTLPLRGLRKMFRKVLRKELQVLLNTPLTKVGYEKNPQSNHNQD